MSQKKYEMIRLVLQILTVSEHILIIPLENGCLYCLRDMEQFMKRDVTSRSLKMQGGRIQHMLYICYSYFSDENWI